MAYFITPKGMYYVGSVALQAADIPVPQRPSPEHIYSQVRGEWLLPVRKDAAIMALNAEYEPMFKGNDAAYLIAMRNSNTALMAELNAERHEYIMAYNARMLEIQAMPDWVEPVYEPPVDDGTGGGTAGDAPITEEVALNGDGDPNF